MQNWRQVGTVGMTDNSFIVFGVTPLFFKVKANCDLHMCKYYHISNTKTAVVSSGCEVITDIIDVPGATTIKDFKKECTILVYGIQAEALSEKWEKWMS